MRGLGFLCNHVRFIFGVSVIGFFLSEALNAAGFPFEVIRAKTAIDDSRFSVVLVGGGHCLRAPGDASFDRFRVSGNHILNAVGISEDAGSLDFLVNYRYVSVRSTADYNRVSCVRPDAKIVPCPSLLLSGV